MRGRSKKDDAAAPLGAAATPFFARFLEGQHDDEDDAEAKVTARRAGASYTEKQGARKTTAAKSAASKKGAKSKAAKPKAAAKLQTLKYPSDGDEVVLYPYHVEAVKTKVGSTRQTLKYPSDGDEGDAHVPVYADAADAPKTARAKPKKDAKISVTRPELDLMEKSS